MHLLIVKERGVGCLFSMHLLRREGCLQMRDLRWVGGWMDGWGVGEAGSHGQDLSQHLCMQRILTKPPLSLLLILRW